MHLHNRVIPICIVALITVFLGSGCGFPPDSRSDWQAFIEAVTIEAQAVHEQPVLVGVFVHQDTIFDTSSRDYVFHYATSDGTFFRLLKNQDRQALVVNDNAFPPTYKLVSMSEYQTWSRMINTSQVSPDDIIKIVQDDSQNPELVSLVSMQLTGSVLPDVPAQSVVGWFVMYIEKDTVKSLFIDPVTGSIIERENQN